MAASSYTWVFLVTLCGQRGTCGHPQEWQDCRPLGAFADVSTALDYQRYYCDEWLLPDCDDQPEPEAFPVINQVNRFMDRPHDAERPKDWQGQPFDNRWLDYN